jgi:hypothetical protein
MYILLEKLFSFKGRICILEETYVFTTWNSMKLWLLGFISVMCWSCFSTHCSHNLQDKLMGSLKIKNIVSQPLIVCETVFIIGFQQHNCMYRYAIHYKFTTCFAVLAIIRY